MARAPSPTSTGTMALRPVASPVDTFVAPPRTNDLLELATSLQSLNPEIGELLATRAAEQKEKDLKQADADHLVDGGEPLAEAVRSGKVPPYMSRAYVTRRKNLEGADIGRRLRGGLVAAWDGWAEKDSDDPAAYDRFVKDYIRQNIGTEDPDILAGAVPAIRTAVDEAFWRHVQHRSTQEREGALRAELAGVSSILDDAEEAGLASGKGLDVAASGDAIDKQRQAYIAGGGTGWDFDLNGMKLVAHHAMATGNESLLGFFDRKVPGQTYTYGETKEGGEIRQEAVQHLAVKARQAVIDGDKAAEKDRQEREDRATLATIESIWAGKPVPEEVIAAGERANPKFRTFVGQWKEDREKGQRNPDLVKQIKRDLLTGGGRASFLRSVMLLESDAEISDAYSFYRANEGSMPSYDDAMGSPVARNFLGVIASRTKAAGSFFDPVSGMSNDGLVADMDFRTKVAEWISAHPNVSSIERDKAIAEIGRSVLEDLVPSPEDPNVMRYQPDEATEEQLRNPLRGMAAKGAQAPEATAPAKPTATPESKLNRAERLVPAQAARRAGEEIGAMVTSGGAPGRLSDVAPPAPESSEAGLSEADAAFFGSFSPEEQAKLRFTATSKGASLPAVLEHARKKGIRPVAKPEGAGPRAPDGTPIDPMSYRPDEKDTGGADARPQFTREMAEQFLDAVLADPDGTASGPRTAKAPDGQAAHLLDLIGKHEAAGNYNAVFGNAKATANLGNLTLDEILGQQQAARRRGVASTAIGRYQFIYKTLRGLKDELGLTGSEKFTPELQDKLGYALLERRGYAAFASGKISKRQFALRLSQEWASLPDPRTGRSFYHGDGLNAAGTSTQAVYAALGFGGGSGGGSSAPLATPASMTAYARPNAGTVPTSGGDAYANMPENEREQFRQWNSDPVANHETNLASIDQTLAGVVRRAQEISGVRFVVGSGKRDAALQKKAKEWGWSKTEDSDHLHGGAVDLWGIDGNGAVTFDAETQRGIVKAMKQAAQELGVELDVGADWRGFRDNPHFALKGRKA